MTVAESAEISTSGISEEDLPLEKEGYVIREVEQEEVEIGPLPEDSDAVDVTGVFESAYTGYPFPTYTNPNLTIKRF